MSPSASSVPEPLQTFYYDLFVGNDTIFTTEYYQHNTFYLKDNQWFVTKRAIDLFYEDDDYNVYSLDFGEWGATTWFEDKKTSKQFEFAAGSPIINKVKDVYFATLGNKVLEIADPHNMQLSKEPYNYKIAVLNGNYHGQGSNSLKGTEAIYVYKKAPYSPSKFFFATSFVSNDHLYHVYSDSISTKIGIMENKKLINVFNFKPDMMPVKWYYNWRNPIQNNSHQSLQFFTKNKNEYGILEINEGKILVITFKNSYAEREMGEIEMKQWFEKSFDYCFTNFNKLNLKDIDSMEQKVNTTNLTQIHKISHYLLDGKDMETPRIYRKIESPGIEVLTSYYCTTKENSIELIEFEWEKNRINPISWEDAIAESLDDPKSAPEFKSKFKWISNYLTSKIGKPDKKHDGDLHWKIENKVVKLGLGE